MILDLVNKLIKPITIIALVSIVATWAFNVQNVLITDTTINGVAIKTVDLRTYLINITNAWETNALNFEDILPSRQWEEVTGSVIDSTFWNALFNNMALIFDWLYFPINFILWILRWISWLLKLLLAVIGWNVGQNNGVYYSQLVEILVWITKNLMIPYI